MNDFIYNQKPINNIEHASNNEYYSIKELHDFIDNNGYYRYTEDNNNVYAKKITKIDGRSKYLIKTGEDKKLFNPFSIYDRIENKKFLETISRNQNSFKEVNYNAFSLYLRFLKTKNLAYLTNAEREI